MNDYLQLVWIVTVIWIGWPLYRIAGYLGFVVKQIKERP